MQRITLTTTDASGGTKTSGTAPLDIYGRPEVSLQAVVTGTATYTVQQTLNNVLKANETITWFDHPDTALVGATASKQGNYAYIPAGVRLVQTAGTGSVTLIVLQAGLHP
jgi:hypothetical protein